MKMRMIVRGFLAVFLLFMPAFFSGCTERREATAPAGVAPDFTLQDLDGKTVTLSEFKGKVVVIDFWATWCPPCRASIPGLESIHREYSSKGVVLLGVSLDDGGWDYVKSFRQEYGITYRILKGTEDVATKYMVRSIPMIVLVDREGKMQKRLLGFGVEEELQKEIKAVL